MEITWLGTAGFKFETGDQVFFTDPFLTRNSHAEPTQTLLPEKIRQADAIFLSHGHFDHIMDVPGIERSTGCDVYCSAVTGNTLEQKGVNKEKINRIISDDTPFSFSQYNARAFFSEHIKFDRKLIFSTLLKINTRLFRFIRLMREYPCGQVLSWRFYVEGRVIHFFGSAGASEPELKRLMDEPIDILLLPLQGHSDICRIGADIIDRLKPQAVIVQHHDNFYPPVSQSIDIRPLLDMVKNGGRPPRVVIPEINQPITL